MIYIELRLLQIHIGYEEWMLRILDAHAGSAKYYAAGMPFASHRLFGSFPQLIIALPGQRFMGDQGN